MSHHLPFRQCTGPNEERFTFWLARRRHFRNMAKNTGVCCTNKAIANTARRTFLKQARLCGLKAVQNHNHLPALNPTL